jgi:hypothetical protein
MVYSSEFNLPAGVRIDISSTFKFKPCLYELTVHESHIYRSFFCRTNSPSSSWVVENRYLNRQYHVNGCSSCGSQHLLAVRSQGKLSLEVRYHVQTISSFILSLLLFQVTVYSSEILKPEGPLILILTEHVSQGWQQLLRWFDTRRSEGSALCYTRMNDRHAPNYCCNSPQA